MYKSYAVIALKTQKNGLTIKVLNAKLPCPIEDKIMIII